MGSPPAAPLPVYRLIGVGAVVFLANAALLVLQLVASRLLAPFIGSDLYTWTSIIGVFLAGIALGNAYGGKLADRYPSPRTLAALLAAGAVAALWMVAFPLLLKAGDGYKAIPLGPRIPLLSAVLCLPAGFVLSLLTPLAIKLGLPDVSKTGRVAGMVFALSTLGCLLGNYLTGFVLIPAFTINVLVYAAAGTLLALAVGTFAVLGGNLTPRPPSLGGKGGPEKSDEPQARRLTPPTLLGKGAGGLGSSFPDIRRAYLVVFLASFGGMTLELVASRLIAPTLGQSLFTWTGIIGVMLAGTAFGNFTGGVLADRANRPGGMRRSVAWLAALTTGLYAFGLTFKGLEPLLRLVGGAERFGLDDPRLLAAVAVLVGGGLAVAVYAAARGLTDEEVDPRTVLGGTLVAAGGATVLMFVSLGVLTRSEALDSVGIVGQVLAWTFTLFFMPMFFLGMVSPQVIRLSVPDVAHAGRVAGRVYAWSTTGAIAGTFAAGYVLVSTLGVKPTLLFVTLLLTATSLAVAPLWRHNLLLYFLSVVLGGVTGGTILLFWTGADPDTVVTVETNYYTIKVTKDSAIADPDGTPRGLKLALDHLVHSTVDPTDPRYIYYTHEHIQMEFLRAARARTPAPRVLVIGGGGYTFPRFAKELLPETVMDVVEIDPGVTKVAYNYLGLKRAYGLGDYNMDGRQFVAERAGRQTYDLLIQDAVNDLSVPWHLLTTEYNAEVKAALKPDGVYLLTVIDSVEHGRLWRAAMATLRETFPHVELLSSEEVPPEAPPPGATDEDVTRWRAEAARFFQGRHVYAIYAADRPLDVAELRAHTTRAAAGGPPLTFYTNLVPAARLRPFLARDPGLILTDQFAPVDNLMADIFRRRNE